MLRHRMRSPKESKNTQYVALPVAHGCSFLVVLRQSNGHRFLGQTLGALNPLGPRGIWVKMFLLVHNLPPTCSWSETLKIVGYIWAWSTVRPHKPINRIMKNTSCNSPLMEKAKGNTIGETKILICTSKSSPVNWNNVCMQWGITLGMWLFCYN